MPAVRPWSPWILVPALLLLLPPALASAANEDLVGALQATVKFVVGPSKGTGFLIQRPRDAGPPDLLLVTAAHAIPPQSYEGKLVARQKRDDGTFERKEFTFPLRFGETELCVRHPELDVAVVPLKFEELRPFALPFDALAGDADAAAAPELGDDVWIPGYPVGLEGNERGFGVLRRGNVASYPLFPAREQKTFIIDASTFGGDSGAPVILRRPIAGAATSRPTIVGVLVGKHQQTDKVSLPFEERTVHHPLGLAIIVQAEFIRQTIALLPR